MTSPLGVAIVGCGTISHQYLSNLTTFPDVRVVACADLDPDRAREVASRYGVPVATTPERAMAHPDVELVVNLTIPSAHAEVAMAAVGAGRHVYNEKPFTLDRESGAELTRAAEAAGVRLGSAPDTFLGAGLQTAARLVAEGAIGTPLTALTLLQTPGPEAWHHSPEFLFQRGAGPLFDMGPYYLTALVTLFGPAGRVAAMARRAREERIIGSGPRAGTRFAVEVPTHTAALLEFAAGQAATMMFTFDSPLHRAGFVEITGTEATMEVPDPNTFGGQVRLRRAAATSGSRSPRREPPPVAGWACSTWPRPSARAAAPRHRRAGPARPGHDADHRRVRRAGRVPQGRQHVPEARSAARGVGSGERRRVSPEAGGAAGAA
ncbi:Gfo/Idh/MocA family protein [Streptosporangium lutulentum]